MVDMVVEMESPFHAKLNEQQKLINDYVGKWLEHESENERKDGVHSIHSNCGIILHELIKQLTS